MPVAYLKSTLEGTPDFFIINMVSANPIDPFTILINYRGRSNPPLTCDMSITEYSLDNKTWYPMTYMENSNLTDIELNFRWGGEYHITWDTMHDLFDKIANLDEGFYNINIWVRFMATSGDKKSNLISYRLFFKNPIVPSTKNPFNDYIGIDGNSLIEHAPEVY